MILSMGKYFPRSEVSKVYSALTINTYPATSISNPISPATDSPLNAYERRSYTP